LRFFERFSLFIFSIFFLTVAVISLLMSIGIIESSLASDFLYSFYTNYNLQLIAAIISIILIILSLFILFKSINNNRTMSFILLHSETGDIRISLDTLENLAVKVGTKTIGVKNLHIKVKPEEDNTVSILARVLVDGETAIPDLSEQLQQAIKSNIERVAGITVKKVHVVIHNIAQSKLKKGRFE